MTRQEHRSLHSASSFLRLHKRTFLLIVAVAAITLVVSASISLMLDDRGGTSLPSIGYIHTIGLKAYWDPNLQNQTLAIDWGTTYVGLSYNVTLYLHSTSNVQTTVSLTTTNWTYINTNNTIAWGPANSTPYINLTLNYNNVTLNANESNQTTIPLSPNETIKTTLTLSTDNSDNFIIFLINNSIKQFTVEITIQANET